MSDFKLFISNERIEQELNDNEPSSASYFEAIVNPSLDLSFLSFLRSNDVELGLDNFTISSAALTFKSDEKIQVYLDMPEFLCDGNWCYSGFLSAKSNSLPMKIPTEDFMTSDSSKALDHINGLFGSKVNKFLLFRYLTMICDETYLFKSEVFRDDIEDEPTYSSHDLSLMRRLLDCSTFSRMVAISTINEILHPGRDLSEWMDTEIHYANRAYSTSEEDRILRVSPILNEKENREKVLTRLIDFDEFSDVPLSGRSGDAERSEITRKIRDRLMKYLDVLGIASVSENLGHEDQVFLERLMFANIEHIKLSRKTVEILTMETQRHNAKKKALSSFTADFLELKVDQSRQKCHFTINHDRLAAQCQLSCFFPPYVSYRLGASKNPDTGQFESVQIGPVGEHISERDKDTPKLTNKITHGFQRLGNSLCVQPKLLCIATDLLAHNSRFQELDAIFAPKSDFVTFFSQKYLLSDTELNFLCKNEQTKTACYKIDRARNILNGFKILIQDENFQKIYFPRDSVCHLTIGFQNSPLTDSF